MNEKQGKQPGAIVIGGHFQGLGAIRALYKADIPVVLIDHEPCLSRLSKCIQDHYKSPALDNEKAYLAFLIDLAENRGLKGWVIYPTDDETVYFLSKNHGQLSDSFKLITPPWEITRYVYNKKETYQLAAKLNIPIPKTWYPGEENDLTQIDHFPVLIKPAVMRSFFKKTGQKVFLAENRKELSEGYRKARQIIPAEEILIQERLMNVTKNLYSFCPVFFNQRVYGRIIAQRPRQHPMDFGQASTYALTVDCPEIERQGIQFLQAIGYYGLGEVEFIYDTASDTYKFLEVNPRIWGWHSLANAAGVNLCDLAFKGIHGKAKQIDSYAVNVKWIRLLTDLPVFLSEWVRGRITLREYINSLKGKREWAVWSFRDPLPFLTELFLLPYLLFKRGF